MTLTNDPRRLSEDGLFAFFRNAGRRAQMAAAEAAVAPTVRLIPPGSPDFTVYGSLDTLDRARDWAALNRLQLVEGVPACPHGMYAMAVCPGRLCTRAAGLDHAELWWRAPGAFGHGAPPELFLLSHSYDADPIPVAAQTLAAAHGLHLDTGWTDDGWYGHGTTPLRFVAAHRLTLWPLEARLLVLSAVLPVAWAEAAE